LFIALCAADNLTIYGGDAKDAFAHSPEPSMPTYMKLDDAFRDWYLERTGALLDKDLVLPTLRALQGHPEAARLWEEHTMHDRAGRPRRFGSIFGFQSPDSTQSTYRQSNPSQNTQEPPPGGSRMSTPIHIPSHFHNLLQIEVPDQEETPNYLLAFDCYRRAVHAIRDNPNAAYAQHCVACRGQHCFENCPTLNDHDFLKQHYI